MMNDPRVSRRRMLGAFAGGAVSTFVTARALNNHSFAGWEAECIPHSSAEGSAETGISDAASESLPIRILLNENPLGCSPKARAAAIDAVSRAQYYPFDVATKLANRLRLKHNMPLMTESSGLSSRVIPIQESHGVTLAGGSTELLFAIAHAFTQDGGSIVEADPSYQALGAFALKRPNSQAFIKRVPLLSDGGNDLEGLYQAIDNTTKVVVINNPNNPTGTASRKSDLYDFLKRVPDNILAVVDEAYIDFLDKPESESAIPLALERDNIIVLRTFSKIHGLAGLRIGYAVGPQATIEQMQNFRVGSFSMNQCGLAAAIASLDDEDFQEQSRKMARESRTRITECLKEFGFNVARCDAACIWAESKTELTSLVEQLAQRGILIASGMRWDRPNCLRISVATSSQTTRLIEAVQEILKS
ncbi:pyridoxal phosphate-dependent aminotransferase [Pirellulaceae bacterium SH449]